MRYRADERRLLELSNEKFRWVIRGRRTGLAALLGAETLVWKGGTSALHEAWSEASGQLHAVTTIATVNPAATQADYRAQYPLLIATCEQK